MRMVIPASDRDAGCARVVGTLGGIGCAPGRCGLVQGSLARGALAPGAFARGAPFAALLLAWGCGAGSDAPGTQADPPAAPGEAALAADPSLSGPYVPPGTETVHLLLGEEGELRLVSCPETLTGSGADLEAARPVEDASGQDVVALVQAFGAPPGGIPARVVLDGDRILELRVAIPESTPERGCLQAFPEGDLEASGNEPFWHLRVEGDEVRVRTPDDLDGTLFHDLTWSAVNGPDAGWRAEALRDFVDGIEYLVLELSETSCVDSMSGARFPWTAVLEEGGHRRYGCAREGRGLPVSF